jgi:hypothetical protein
MSSVDVFKNCALSSSDKNKAAVILALVFALISSPMVYSLVDGLVAKISGQAGMISSYDGHPTPMGMAVHAVVFALIVRLMLRK